MAPLRLSWSVEGKPVSVTVEAQTTTTDGDCSPRETNPKAAKSTSGSSSEDDVPVYLHCGNDSLSDEEVDDIDKDDNEDESSAPDSSSFAPSMTRERRAEWERRSEDTLCRNPDQRTRVAPWRDARRSSRGRRALNASVAGPHSHL